mgnify:FL=1
MQDSANVSLSAFEQQLVADAEWILTKNRIIEKVYQKLNCKGAVRIDYFLESETGKFYFIEINTVPGQTETSLISQQVRALGIDVKDFYNALIEEMFS